MTNIRAILAATLLSISTSAFAGTLEQDVFAPSVQIGDYCSGTIIHSDRDRETGEVETFVLTAKHCTKSVGEHTVVRTFDHDGSLDLVKTTAYEAEVWGQSYKSDLALLKLSDDDTVFDVAKVAPKDIKLTFGEDAYITSFPIGLSMTFTKGNLGYIEDQYTMFSTSGRFLRATPAIAPGSSGGNLFVKRGDEYQIIGVVTAGYFPVSFINLFTPVDEINEYLDVASKSWKNG